MSKKKRRYNKRKKRRNESLSSNVCDRHHLFWTRKAYDKCYWSHKLRNHPYCIVLIPKNTLHRELHIKVKSVPVPNEMACRDAFNELERLMNFGAIKETDNIIKRLELLIFILDYVSEDTVKALRQQKVVATQFYSKGS